MYQLGLSQDLIVDSFAGGGGASTGIEQALGHPVHVAINHDRQALAMHAANHPYTQHLCEDVWEVNPRDVVPERPVGLLWASPDCKHFSKAKGGAPVSKRVRGLAWVVIRWAATRKPRVIVLENVEEFVTWGPIVDGKPDLKRKGRHFRSFVKRLQNEGYAVDWRELRACDYGAPTIRKRLFLIARRDGLPIAWPAPTHGKPGSGLKPYRTAADIIDWNLPCPSIFERKKPLAENTMRRIAKGVMKYVINNPRPFIVKVNHTGYDQFRGQELSEPLQTVTSKHGYALVEPFLAGVGGRAGCSPERPLGKPFQTITTKADTVLVTPYIVPTGYGEREDQEPRTQSAEQPLNTVVGQQKHAMVAAFLAKHYGGVVGTGVDVPTGTVTTSDHHSLVTAHIMKMRGDNIGHGADEPLHTVSAGGKHHAEVRAFLIKYFGTDQDPRVDEPLHTVTTKHRFGLVTVEGQDYQIVDIGMRMLTPRELYRAQGFPDTYIIDRGADGQALTKEAQVRMCGNSVCPVVARAVIESNVCKTPLFADNDNELRMAVA